MPKQDLFKSGSSPIDDESTRIINAEFPHLAAAMRGVYDKLPKDSHDREKIDSYAINMSQLTLFGAQESGRMANMHTIKGERVDIAHNAIFGGTTSSLRSESAIESAKDLSNRGWLSGPGHEDALGSVLERNGATITPEIKGEFKKLMEYAKHPKENDHVQDRALALQKALENHHLPEDLKRHGISPTSTAVIYARGQSNDR